MSSRPDGATIADALGLRRRGSEWVGPCPRCGGTDRFHVRARDGLFGCRGCGDDAAGLFEAVMRAAGCWDNSPAAARRNYGPSPPVPRRQPREPARKPDYRHVSVAAYGASVAAYGTPAAGYLDRRGVWPESRSDELPASVRWLPARLAPTEIRGSLADYLAHPDAVAGLAMYVYRTREGELTCAKFEAISAAGQRLNGRDGAAWKRNYGKVEGGLFVPLDTDGGDWHLTEGEADALAVASTLETGRVVCAAGTAGWKLSTCDDARGRRIVLHPDNDYAGLNKARRLHESLVAASVDVAVMLSRVDPAADRAERIHETNGPE